MLIISGVDVPHHQPPGGGGAGGHGDLGVFSEGDMAVAESPGVAEPRETEPTPAVDMGAGGSWMSE